MCIIVLVGGAISSYRWSGQLDGRALGRSAIFRRPFPNRTNLSIEVEWNPYILLIEDGVPSFLEDFVEEKWDRVAL